MSFSVQVTKSQIQQESETPSLRDNFIGDQKEVRRQKSCFITKCESTENAHKVTTISHHQNIGAPCLKLSVASLSELRPGLNPRPVRIKCVMDNVAVGQVFNSVLRFSLSASFHKYPALINSLLLFTNCRLRQMPHTHKTNTYRSILLLFHIYFPARKQA